jgi:hypothetical protein
MEVIGFTASLITLAATALNSTKVLYEFLSNIKDNPEELKNLRSQRAISVLSSSILKK